MWFFNGSTLLLSDDIALGKPFGKYLRKSEVQI